MAGAVNLLSSYQKNQLETVILKAINFLKLEQKKAAFFGSESIFPSSLILDCLNECHHQAASSIKKVIADELQTEKSSRSTFNYWRKESRKRQSQPYPDDLDDTCCTWSALYRFNPETLGGWDLANLARVLNLCEIAPGGPYRSSILAKKPGWQDVDIAVNSNVAYFLKLQKTRLQHLDKLVQKAIEDCCFFSPFYNGELPVVYFMSRFYRGKLKWKLKEKLCQAAGPNAPAMATALIISSLYRLGFEKAIGPDLIKNLIKQQSADGSFETDGFYLEGYHRNKPDYFGSRSLSTAFVIEALSLILEKEPEVPDPESERYRQAIANESRIFLKKLRGNARVEAGRRIGQVLNSDESKKVWFLPIILSHCLKENLKVPSDFLVKAALINLYGWCAYTIYDDILDGDETSNYLPVANIFHQELNRIVFGLKLPDKSSFLDLYQQIVTRMELMNYEEIKLGKSLSLTKCHQLSDKSLGYAISSLAIFYLLGYPAQSRQSQNLLAFFQDYLAARQMNDDIHDWEDDLKKNFLNSAGREFIDRYRKSRPDQEWDIARLRIFAWKESVPDYCQKILFLLSRARKKIEKIDIIQMPDLLDKMLREIEISVKLTLTERQRTLDFIENYF